MVGGRRSRHRRHRPATKTKGGDRLQEVQKFWPFSNKRTFCLKRNNIKFDLTYFLRGQFGQTEKRQSASIGTTCFKGQLLATADGGLSLSPWLGSGVRQKKAEDGDLLRS